MSAWLKKKVSELLMAVLELAWKARVGLVRREVTTESVVAQS